MYDNAKQAAKETEKHAIYETVVSAMELNDNQEIDYVLTADKAKIALENDGKNVEDPTIEPNNDPPRAILTVTGKYGTYQIEINGKEIKFLDDSNPLGGGGNDAVLDKLANYILGPENESGVREGRVLFEILDEGESGFTFLYPDGDEDTVTYQNVKIASYDEDENGLIFYIRYYGDVYSFSADENFKTDGLTLIQDNQGNLGKYVRFSNSDINWIVLSENDSDVELISADTLGNVELSGKAGYNNAIETLVTACQNLVKNNGQYISSNITSARCTGGPITDEIETYDENGYKVADTYYLSDYNKMNPLKVFTPDNGQAQGYLIASRCREQGHPSIRIWVFKFGIGEDIGDWVDENNSKEGPVRPVITVNKSAFNNASGTGLYTDPIIIN